MAGYKYREPKAVSRRTDGRAPTRAAIEFYENWYAYMDANVRANEAYDEDMAAEEEADRLAGLSLDQKLRHGHVISPTARHVARRIRRRQGVS